MARLREPKRLPDRFYLVMRKVGTRTTARIPITQAEHDLSQTECENKIRREGRLPRGRWEHNAGGIARLGGVWTFEGTTNGDLEPGDGYFDAGRLVINPQAAAPLLEFSGTDWDIGRSAGGLTVRRRTDNTRPVSISLEDGTLTVRDLTNIPGDEQ